MATSYEKRLKIPITGNPLTVFTTPSGLHIATGYNRIVLGGRGPYIEFEYESMKEKNMIVPDSEEYRLWDKRVYYIELRTTDVCKVKIYFQLKKVSYADYKLNKVYISPFDLLANGEIIIEKLH